jgi:hypothetical protein
MYQGMDCVRATTDEEEERLASARVVAIGIAFPIVSHFFCLEKDK